MSVSPSVVLLHSSMSSGQQWQKLQQMLTLPSITPDLMGYGEASMPEHTSAEHRLHCELTHIGPNLPEQPFHLVGHSYGAATAIRLARTQPERVISLTLYEPVAFHLLAANQPPRISVAELDRTVVRHLKDGRADRAAACFIDFWNTPGTFDRLNETMQAAFCKGVQKVAYDFAALLNETCTPQDLTAIRCPVLLLEGDDSPAATRAVVQVLNDALPDAERHSLECGHMGPITHSHLVNPIVSRFIAEHHC